MMTDTYIIRRSIGGIHMSEQLKTLCAILSVIVSTGAFIPYFIETWRVGTPKDARPTVSGFVCWVLSDFVILAAMIAGDSISWQMVPYVTGGTILIGLCMRKNLKIAALRGEAGTFKDAFLDWTNRDTACIVIVAAAITAWAIKHDPDYAIYLTIFSCAIGTYAIAVPLMEDPYKESMFSWGLFFLGGLFGIVAIPAWTVTGAAAPITFSVLQGLMFALCARRYLSRYLHA